MPATRRGLLGLTAATLAAPSLALAQGVEISRAARFRVTTFAEGLDHPWGAALLPDGRMLVTERPGRLRVVGRDGRLSAPIAGVPQVLAQGQGGLLDVALGPDFLLSGEIFFSQAALVEGGALTRLVRARLSPDLARLLDVTPILDATPAQAQGRNHYGGRIAVALDGTLFLATGERYVTKMRAQRLDDLGGKILRLTREGAPAPGNPFIGQPGIGQAGARPEIWSYGHRNPQGLAFNPATGTLFEAEFGARGGDEVNIIRRGGNYGWPILTHGVDYDGSRIGEGSTRPDMEDAEMVWVPSVSPSGIAFHTGEIEAWRGDLFLACLNPPGLVRLAMQGDRVTGEERLLWNRTRFRDVIQGADGRLHILTDEAQGRILRIDPA
ncbi:glucose/arabinose dehydrogenase [Humitalea rosea]|uniref:Glucose/arabinose dehydrogenase n=1 Tax=Humitalea rosea TaxID=990373 RepID=A0A2W7KGY5_9PROT|nr:PQQ-dependent sugar dehydrogenase [Humitalea rosea]PZW47083.1 glucose/arabinose dehydrogenase [Humitalea rosea]